MKSTTQIIAATAFASLLFAPLAKANPGGGPITFRLEASFSISATKIDFGQVVPDGDNNAVLTITCNSDDDSATAKVDNFDTRVSGNPTCGVVTVTSIGSPIIYTLAVTDVTALTDEGESHSISPTLVIHPNGRADSPIATVPAGETSTSGGRSIAANASEVFKVAGSMPIAANQAEGTYTGTYTVTAQVQ